MMIESLTKEEGEIEKKEETIVKIEGSRDRKRESLAIMNKDTVTTEMKEGNTEQINMKILTKEITAEERRGKEVPISLKEKLKTQARGKTKKKCSQAMSIEDKIEERIGSQNEIVTVPMKID